MIIWVLNESFIRVYDEIRKAAAAEENHHDAIILAINKGA